MNIGNCNLHIFHGVFQREAETTDLRLKRLLKHLHFLFHNAGARRGDFFKVTGSKQFPLPFCIVRWLESKTVAEQAVNIWQNVKKLYFIGKVKKNCIPDGKCFKILLCNLLMISVLY